ncbi:MAG: ATP-binding cassette domain-containing protein [Chitinophagaceae bacterium]|nr:MAG: ATP-binding cassette domain-containing protein [Chitinophagaceae bacterium]
MTPFEGRLAEVQACFSNHDFHLGYRRLLDAAIETADFVVYRDTLRFCDAYDALPAEGAEGERTRLAADLLTRLARSAPHTTPQPQYLLRAEGVAKRYRRGRFGLSPVDLELRPGQVTGIVGENGNGKTTFLRLLYGELRPDAGRLHYGFAAPGDDAYAIKTALAFIPQRPQSWYGSLMENLQYASTYAGYTGGENLLWTEMIVARMGLRPFRSYDWSRISSGYKMRFELARTLLRRPRVLLLDEPLANLDILAQQVILEDLRYLAASESMPLGIVLSSQQLYEVEKVSDDVLFLQQGRPHYRPLHPQELPLVLELETAADREALQALLTPLGLQRQSFNGGVHILYFAPGTALGPILSRIGEAGLPLQYLRDITHSSRRFFVA